MISFFQHYIAPTYFTGICYGIAAIGISLPLRFLQSADFTALGSVMLGGVVAITGTNQFGPVVGTSLGIAVGGGLGILTAALKLYLRIPLMLAGIIAFTGSKSLGFYFAGDGQIPLSEYWMDKVRIHVLKFSELDWILLTIMALVICVCGFLLGRSKFGSFAFAMCGTERFVRFRHRRSNLAVASILFCANALVAFSGALLALKSSQAYVDIDPGFLSLTLGAIFTGDAVVRLLARFLKADSSGPMVVNASQTETVQNLGWFDRFRVVLTKQRDDSERMGVILMSYVVSAIVLNAIMLSIQGHAFPFDVPPMLEHVALAFCITVGLVFSRHSVAFSPARKASV